MPYGHYVITKPLISYFSESRVAEHSQLNKYGVHPFTHNSITSPIHNSSQVSTNEISNIRCNNALILATSKPP